MAFTRCPRSARLRPSWAHCVDLPALSSPSKTISAPREGVEAVDIAFDLGEPLVYIDDAKKHFRQDQASES